MNILTIDPGAKECAFAYFAAWGGSVHLAKAWFGTVPDYGCPDVVVVEAMQLDSRSRALDLRHVLACQANGHRAAGWAEGRGARFVALTPTEWKGSEQKPVQHARAWSCLSGEERHQLGGDATGARIEDAVRKGALRRWAISGVECYPSTWKIHNLLDAACLGLIYVGRMEKR